MNGFQFQNYSSNVTPLKLGPNSGFLVNIWIFFNDLCLAGEILLAHQVESNKLKPQFWLTGTPSVPY
jgi:hypothetical protein